MEEGYSQARALPPPQGFHQCSVVSRSCQERGILAASRAVGQGGFCGTAVTPSGDTREIPGSRELLPRPALGDQLTGLQMPRSIKKEHQLSLRAPVGALKHIFKGSPHI